MLMLQYVEGQVEARGNLFISWRNNTQLGCGEVGLLKYKWN